MRITQTPVSIHTLLHDAHFGGNHQCQQLMIPIYQRPYAWTTEQCEETFDDCVDWIKQNFDSNTSYEEHLDLEDFKYQFYMGLVITARLEELAQLEIVDGQQRLTTISLALCSLYNLLEELNVDDRTHRSMRRKLKTMLSENQDQPPKLCHQFDGDSNTYQAIMQHICHHQGLANDVKKTNMYKNFQRFKTLIGAYIHQKASTEEDRGNLLLLMTKIFLNTRFLVLETEGAKEKLTLFKTLNSRGVALSDGDLIKNAIYQNLLAANAVNDDGFSHLIHQWNLLRDDFDKSSDFDKSIYYYVNSRVDFKPICQSRYGSKDQIIREKHLFAGVELYLNHLSNSGQRHNVNQLDTFTNDLMKGIEIAYSIATADTPELEGFDFDSVFITLKDFSVKKSYPLVIYIYQTFAKEFTAQAFQMLEWLEALIVRFLVNKLEPRPLTEFFHSLMVKIDQVFNETDDINAVLNVVYETISRHYVFSNVDALEAFKANLNLPMSSNRISSLYRRVYFNKYDKIKKVKINASEGIKISNYVVHPKNRALRAVYAEGTPEYQLLARPSTIEETQARGQQVNQAIDAFFTISRT